MMDSEKEIDKFIEESINDSSICELIDGSTIDLQDINAELDKKNQWFSEKENNNMLTSIQDIVLNYRDLVHIYNNETEKLFNISNNIDILEKYKKNNKILILPTHYAFGFLLSNEYNLKNHDKYPLVSNDISDKLREKLYNEKEIRCGVELSRQEYKCKKKTAKTNKKFTHFYRVLSANEDVLKYFSKEDLISFIDLQINSFKLTFKYQKIKCENIKKKLDKYRDSVVSISDDYEKLIGFLKSTNPDIKELFIKNKSIYDKEEDE